MCDPLTIAGAVLTIGSTVAKSMAQSEVAEARRDAMAAERIRQNALDQEAQALNTQSQDRYQNFDQQQTDRGNQLGDYFKSQTIDQGAANQQAAQDQAVPASNSNIVVQEDARKKAQARAFTDQQGQALGNLRSFGDLVGSIGRLQARDAGKIGQVGDFKKGSSNALSYELDAANSAGSDASMFGDLLGLGGSFALNKGLQGSFTSPSLPTTSINRSLPTFAQSSSPFKIY